MCLLSAIILVLFSAGRPCAREKDDPKNSIEPGFIRIFNGQDLSGWEGDPKYWSVMDHVIRGQGTKKQYSKCNTFLIWKGGITKDFVLKLKFKLYYGNSGVQYRSRQLSDENSKWRVFGYQSEIADPPDINAFLFDEGAPPPTGRWILAHDGEFVVIDENGRKHIKGQVCDAVKLNEAEFSKTSQWNDCTIIVRGNHFMHFVNGYQIIEAIDNDPKRLLEGILALQLHGSGPGIVEFKDIYIKQLNDKYGNAVCLFNGQNLDGWTFNPAGVKDGWSIRDGGVPPETEQMIKIFQRKAGDVDFNNSVIVNKGEPKGSIRTAAEYSNYILRLQFRHLSKEGGGGVLLRMGGEDQIGFKCIKVDLSAENAGDLWGIGRFPMKGSKGRTKKVNNELSHTLKMNPSNEKALGEWNQCEIAMEGENLEIKINNVTQNIASGCRQGQGKIGFQSEGGRMEFRNVILIPIRQ